MPLACCIAYPPSLHRAKICSVEARPSQIKLVYSPESYGMASNANRSLASLCQGRAELNFLHIQVVTNGASFLPAAHAVTVTRHVVQIKSVTVDVSAECVPTYLPRVGSLDDSNVVVH
ncbi:hypothetical protein F5X98DRAFT_105971 [Xylaria grammica]|nr:hypothetical protein F5X98DRAFT_105971 [Xylaria grammica]